MKKEPKQDKKRESALRVQCVAAYVTCSAVCVSLVIILFWFHLRLTVLEQRSLLRDQEVPEKIRVKRQANAGKNTAEVEFIYPKRPGDASQPAVSPDGSNGNPDDWVWLTSYSRIPVPAMQEFCAATKKYCPPGPPGPTGPPGMPGRPGEKGNPGSPGQRGQTGNLGNPGQMGPRGQKGEPGIPGLPGTDGRDGLPGEPGLDGIPGRNGLDGIPGSDGIPGDDGNPGTPGRNGSDGIPGSQGPQGPPGPQGLQGPRGPPGSPGTPGTHGIPGVQTWSYNATDGKLLIPPTIVGATAKQRPLEVKEEDRNVRLRCSASGVPVPIITWERTDNIPIKRGKNDDVVVEGPVLHFYKVNRQHIGEYRCSANNGVPPVVQKTYGLEVHFPPLIKIQNQNIGGVVGGWAVLECEVEAFPVAITYWERSEGRVIENSSTYSITSTEYEIYKIRMTLNITRIHNSDFGKFFCASKNIHGITKGEFNLYVLDPNKATPPPKGKKFGKESPELVDIDQICPTPPACPDCPAVRRNDTSLCSSGGYALLDMVGFEILPLGNLSFPEANNRTQDCILSAVGKPVFNRFSSAHPVGAWMRDPVKTGVEGDKYYVIIYQKPFIFEFANKTAFQNYKSTRNLTLPHAVNGNYHAIYNGSFYYVSGSDGDLPRIIGVDLSTGNSYKGVELPFASNITKDSGGLYKANNSWVDLATDENGLWAIHTLPESNNTAVVKIDPNTMVIQYGWNITISHLHAGDMFIICGVLYAVDSIAERETKIRLALDLYRRRLAKVDLTFANPFRETSYVSYNPRTKELFTWDKGNQLIYPIKVTAMEDVMAK